MSTAHVMVFSSYISGDKYQNTWENNLSIKMDIVVEI